MTTKNKEQQSTQFIDLPLFDVNTTQKNNEVPEPKLSENALIVLNKRYFNKDEAGKVIEDGKGMFLRVAEDISRAEEKYGGIEAKERYKEVFYRMMANLDFLPNSPTLMNAGKKLQQLSACFVLPVGDSMEEIFESVKHTALIHKSGGGTGFSFSKIRGTGSVVSTTKGVASGPVSFMKVFDSATETVKQGGTRRGANMAILRVDHPDITEFINCKKDQKALNNFNISVAITDEFMQALYEDRDYALIDPKFRKAVGHISAKKVFNMIVDNAHRNGEPGILFIDRVNKYNPTPEIGQIESTNPCVTEDTVVFTSKGPRKVRNLINKKFTLIADGKLWETGKDGFFSTGMKKVYSVITKEGFALEATADHPVKKVLKITRNKVIADWEEIRRLKQGDRILMNNHRDVIEWEGEYTFGDGYLIGLLIGDGTIKKDKTILSSWGESEGPKNVRKIVYDFILAKPHRSDFTGWHKVKNRSEYRLSTSSLTRLANKFNIYPRHKVVSYKIEKTSSDFHRGFIRGIFDADGSVQGNQSKGISIRLSQSKIDSLKIIQNMLLRFGIYSKIYSNRRSQGFKLMPDGKGGKKLYKIKAQHELVISNDNIKIFTEKIGFGDLEKENKLLKLIKRYKRKLNKENFIVHIDKIKYSGEKKVYDVKVPGINSFDANGFYVHNCGEQPLLPYESCNLGSINLSNFVNEEKKIDFVRLGDTVDNSVRFLDDVIEMNNYPLKQIEINTLGNRKIGLGVMGFADMLLKMDVSYNSERGVEIGGKVMRFINERAHQYSETLGKERGNFPNHSKSIYKDIPFKRNATVTTIAPTGTISLIAGTSSGVEPLFALSYYRNVLDGNKLPEIHYLFKEKLEQLGLLKEELISEAAEKATLKDIKEIPEEIKKVFVTSHDIEPEWHVKMQAEFQKYTDNAVSKTVNLPNASTKDDVKKIYLLAYKTGCKGVTVYRDGSRDEQVLIKTKAGKTREVKSPRKRPNITQGKTVRMNTGCGRLYVTINEDEFGLCEVFSTMGKAGGCTASQCEAISRLISLSLRSGVETKEIIVHLKGISCPNPGWDSKGQVLSCADAIARCVELYEESKNKNCVKSMKVKKMLITSGGCPSCGGTMVNMEGCSTCRVCGYSKCG